MRPETVVALIRLGLFFLWLSITGAFVWAFGWLIGCAIGAGMIWGVAILIGTPDAIDNFEKQRQEEEQRKGAARMRYVPAIQRRADCGCSICRAERAARAAVSEADRAARTTGC